MYAVRVCGGKGDEERTWYKKMCQHVYFSMAFLQSTKAKSRKTRYIVLLVMFLSARALYLYVASLLLFVVC